MNSSSDGPTTGRTKTCVNRLQDRLKPSVVVSRRSTAAVIFKDNAVAVDAVAVVFLSGGSTLKRELVTVGTLEK